LSSYRTQLSPKVSQVLITFQDKATSDELDVRSLLEHAFYAVGGKVFDVWAKHIPAEKLPLLQAVVKRVQISGARC
jgi:hypothetical protein